MAWTKAKIAVAVAAVLAISIVAITTERPVHLKSAVAYPGDWIWEANSQTLDRVPPLLLLRPTQFPASWNPIDMYGNHRYLARSKTLSELMTAVWSQKNSSMTLIFQAPLPDGKFDCIVTLQNTNWPDALEAEINSRFRLVEQYETQGSHTVLVVKRSL